MWEGNDRQINYYLQLTAVMDIIRGLADFRGYQVGGGRDSSGHY